jgi:hypothetical protein
VLGLSVLHCFHALVIRVHPRTADLIVTQHILQLITSVLVHQDNGISVNAINSLVREARTCSPRLPNPWGPAPTWLPAIPYLPFLISETGDTTGLGCGAGLMGFTYPSSSVPEPLQRSCCLWVQEPSWFGAGHLHRFFHRNLNRRTDAAHTLGNNSVVVVLVPTFFFFHPSLGWERSTPFRYYSQHLIATKSDAVTPLWMTVSHLFVRRSKRPIDVWIRCSRRIAG